MPVKTLLGSLEKDASDGKPIAVIRILSPADGSMATTVFRLGDPLPRVRDEQVTARIASAVGDLAREGADVNLIEIADADGNQLKLVVELVRNKLHVVIFGGGHVGQAVALMSAIVGYRVTVVDDREEFASRKRLADPTIELLVGDYASASGRLELSSNSAVVIVTRGHQYDEVCLRSVIRSEARYVGMIGSRRRVLAVLDRLNREGFSREELSRLHAPIGLKIGARSPQEIAVSIIAEIINHLNNSESDFRGR
jgi:xanthine/CO dehydrogenase XdhC/CoxF family maturation factor